MRKLVVFLFLFVVILPVFAYESAAYPFYMVGYVDSATDFSVSILNEVLPFDLNSSEVAYNANWNTLIKGLRIGYYSLISNNGNFSLIITHTPLNLITTKGSNDPGTLSSIDYRLYAIADYNNEKYLTCISDDNASNPINATNKIKIAGDNEAIWETGATMCSIINQSLYVSLEDNAAGDTKSTIDKLISGTYSSTVYFLLEGE